MDDLRFAEFTAKDVIELAPYFSLRPNKGSYSVSVMGYLYNSHYPMKYCRMDDGLLLIYSHEGEAGALMPYCREERLPEYFRRLEEYFNNVLKQPLLVVLADEEGFGVLRESGSLGDYDCQEEPQYSDYIYDGESLRTLAGRKFSKKRNHINKFLQLYGGRWEYRRLAYDDAAAVIGVLNSWIQGVVPGFDSSDIKDVVYYPAEVRETIIEYIGVRNILKSEALTEHLHIGGIFIDGELKAFAIGDYNPLDKMAVVNVEKADDSVPGLYQIVNREFVAHEFPEALLVNREDDAGQENLRKAKLSYFPLMQEKKYTLRQRKD